MNTFGRIFRLSIFGESHGPAVGITIDGCPPGLALDEGDFETDMKRRQGGTLQGTTPRREADEPQFLSGLFNGHTTGAPLTIIFANANTRSTDYEKQRAVPRPGHADFVASQRFGGFEDYRGGGHFSGRLTVCLVAAGVVAKKLLPQVEINARITELGGLPDIDAGLAYAIAQQDSVGGIVECRVAGLKAGLGEPFWNSLESMLAHAVFAIPAVRGIEFGTGFSAARMLGSDHNDSILDAAGSTATNHAGGINGGLSNGAELVFRIAIKPASSTPKQQRSYNIQTGAAEDFAVRGATTWLLRSGYRPYWKRLPRSFSLICK